jgi:hypothetical protein
VERFKVITNRELAEFAAVLEGNGWREQHFELQEDAFDPATAEVEASAGRVGIRCFLTEAVEAYPIGPGFTWVTDFADDLKQGKFGRPPKT